MEQFTTWRKVRGWWDPRDRPASLGPAGQRPGLHLGWVLIFFVLVGLIHGEAPELVGNLEEMLVTLVPLGADLAEEHRSLVGPAQLQESYSADVGTKPAGIFHVVPV